MKNIFLLDWQNLKYDNEQYNVLVTFANTGVVYQHIGIHSYIQNTNLQIYLWVIFCTQFRGN